MKTTMRRFAAMVILAASGFSFGYAATNASGADDVLTIGSDAPSLDIEHWVQDGNGRFGKVTKFTNGKVYVVEFWATWCGPCIASMPHIVELQKKYADKGVQVISISDEPLDTVEEFLEREVPRSEQAKTFRELTKSYTLTTDPDRSSHESYMEPAKQNGIPCAFIVGKDGKIEWIGHPMQMDDPLEAVVSDKWDREKFAEDFKESQELDGLMQEMQVKVGGLVRRKKFDEALEALDTFVDKVKKPELKLNFTMIKLNLHQMAGSKDEAVATTFKDAFALVGDNPLAANQIAWTVWEWKDRGQLENKETLTAALEVAKKAAAKQEGNMRGMTLDTVSHLEFALGNLDAAVKAQEEAIKLVDGPQQPDMESFLEELKGLLKSKK